MTKIGILDDEVIICETISKYLKESGYDVPDYAVNYEEAVSLLKEHAPDIMLLDINIGGNKNGVDLAMYIRENYNIPVIFISSYSDKNTIEAAKKAKPNGYLVKPFSKDDLYASIEIAINSFTHLPEQPLPGSDNSIKLLPDALFVKQQALFVKIYFKEILFIKSESVYAEIFTRDKKLLIRETLKNLSGLLPAKDFSQIHRSYLVNINNIDAVNTEYVVINNEQIPISRSQRDAFLSHLNLLK